jgi:aryl-alcohol dehydrogenase-like predicted oxidoreductase
MQTDYLGNSQIKVSKICLGTMTWGEQNTQSEAHAQLDYALDAGVNFIDTAEMYPVPPKAETYSKTETIIGNWPKLQTRRDKIVLATKVYGPAEWAPWLRGGPRLSKKQIHEAFKASLQRLKTDYIDLYQLHWPDRQTNFFGQRGFSHLEKNFPETPLRESLSALDELVKEGLIRSIGLSNETPWGFAQALALSNYEKKTRLVSIQNPYSLLNRTYEIGMAEISLREKVGLLAYSPLGFGVLSGKYLNGKMPANARLSLWTRFSRYSNANGIMATQKYCDLARKFGLSPVQLALSFVNSRPFVTSNIIGATNLDQLKENISSAEIKLSPEILSEIEAIHQILPDPCP